MSEVKLNVIEVTPDVCEANSPSAGVRIRGPEILVEDVL